MQCYHGVPGTDVVLQSNEVFRYLQQTVSILQRQHFFAIHDHQV